MLNKMNYYMKEDHNKYKIKTRNQVVNLRKIINLLNIISLINFMILTKINQEVKILIYQNPAINIIQINQNKSMKFKKELKKFNKLIISQIVRNFINNFKKFILDN